MVLSDKNIKKLIDSGDITIEPFDPSNLKGGSYTLTLDNKARKLKNVPFIDTRTDKQQYEEITIDDNGYILDPGEFIVGLTKEKITLSAKVCGALSTRGSRAQAGLNALQSSLFIEPGSNNQMALEIQNVSAIPIKLFPGIKIVKCIFLPLINP